MRTDTSLKEKSFDLVFRKYGKRWTPEFGIDEADGKYGGMLLEFIRGVVNAQKKNIGLNGPIYCDFVLNPNFNAIATNSDAGEFIAIFSGACSHLLAGFHCMLSDPNFLPNIGDPSKHKLSNDALESFMNYRPLSKPHHHPEGERLSVAMCLTWLACSFLALHEVGHIVNNHTEFLRRKFGIVHHQEVSFSYDEKHISDLLLAFEWEADEYAANTSYQLTQELIKRENFKGLRPLGADLAWGIATSMIFVIIARLSNKWNNGARTHPAPAIRYAWSGYTIHDAKECAQYKPQQQAMSSGFSNVIRWFHQHQIQILSDSRSENIPMESALEKFSVQHKAAKSVLDSEKKLLEILAHERRLNAEAWLNL